MCVSEFFNVVKNSYFSRESLVHTIISLTVPIFTVELSKRKCRELTERPHYLIVSFSIFLILIIH